MLLPSFEFHRPRDLAEAVQTLDGLGPTARVLAGGTDLLVDMKTGKDSPEHLVSIQNLEELAGIARGGALRISAGVTAAELEGNPASLNGFSALVQGATNLGSSQIRNRATLGGNICSARAAGDLIPPLLVLDGRLALLGCDGAREVRLDDFLLGGRHSIIEPGEILTSVMLDPHPEGSGSSYKKLGLRRAMEIARVSAAAWLRLEADGKTIQDARVALGAVGPRAALSPKARAVLVGEAADEELFARAGEAAVEDASPRTCHEFKCEVVSVLTRRCLVEAWEEARGRAS